MAFIYDPSYKPFLRFSQAAIDTFTSVSRSELASCVPYVRIARIDIATGKPFEDEPEITFDSIAPPDFGQQVGNGVLLERAPVSFESIKIKYEDSFGYSFTRRVEMTFTVHNPYIVFYGDEKHTAWRHLLEEGNSFLVEYGWRGGATTNAFFDANGVGYYDEQNGLFVPSVRRMRFNMTSWTFQLQGTSEVSFTVQGIEDGEITAREGKIGRFLDFADLVKKKTVNKKLNKAAKRKTLDPQVDRDRDGLIRIAQEIDRLKFKKGKEELIKFSDLLDTLIYPVLKVCSENIGYDLVARIGSFGPITKTFDKRYGGQDLSGKSIGEATVNVKDLLDLLGQQVSNGEDVLTVQNFISNLLVMLMKVSAYKDERSDRVIPEILVKTNIVKISNRDKLAYEFSIVDRRVSTFESDLWSKENRIDIGQQTKEKIFQTLRQKGIPIITLGHMSGLVLSLDGQTMVDEMMRAVLTDSAMKARKGAAAVTSGADRDQRDGRSKLEDSRTGNSFPSDFVFFKATSMSIGFVGNHMLEFGQTFWLDVFDVYPISGIFSVISRDDELTPAGWTTSIGVKSDGTDPFNTRQRFTRDELNTRDEIERQNLQKADAEAAKKKRSAGRNK